MTGGHIFGAVVAAPPAIATIGLAVWWAEQKLRRPVAKVAGSESVAKPSVLHPSRGEINE